MELTDRIHCDTIIFCTKAELQIEIDRRFNAPMSVERLLAKFPLTYRKDPEDERDYLLSGSEVNILESEGLDDAIDHTPKMSPVKNQGQLGSCVGFAVTAMKEWQERHEHEEEVAAGKRDIRKGKIYDLSESWLYWKSKEIDAWPGEEGTSIRYAMKVLNRIGVPTESAWPYDDVDFGEPKGWADMIARWALIDSYWRINNMVELKAALTDGPVPIGIPCFYEIFFTGDDGLIEYPENPNQIYGGHAICAVGYDDNTKLVKIKNSWGYGWGENGYGYLPYDYIDDFLWDAWSCKDLSVTREMLKGTREL